MPVTFNVIEEKDCESCSKCYSSCPNYPFKAPDDFFKLLNCIHCKDPKCLAVCPKNAIYKVSDSIVKIDQNKCNGCGLCLKACEQNAIIMKNKKAYKCDLCYDFDYKINCTCPKNYIQKVQSKEAKELQSSVLGWRSNFLSIKHRTLSKNDSYSIIEDFSNNKKEKFLKINLPSYSEDELKIISNIISLLDNKEIKKDFQNEVLYLIESYCLENYILIDQEQIVKICEGIEKRLLGYGELSVLIDDPDIEELSVSSSKKDSLLFAYHKYHGWLKTNLSYTNNKMVVDIVNKMATSIGRRLTLENPRLNAALPNGSRLYSTIYPVSTNCIFTIRKFQKDPFSLVDLVKFDTVSKEALVFLWMYVNTDSNLLVCGNTGSGKTSTLNTLLTLLPKNERVVVVEETPEFNVFHKNIVKVNVVPELKIKMSDLIYDTMRMRPDRLVVGEIRNKEEVLAYINTILAGQGKSSYATFHAQSSKDFINRLKFFSVPEHDISNTNLLVVQKRLTKNDLETCQKTEIRRIVEISFLEYKNNKLTITEIFSYDEKNDTLIFNKFPKALMDKFSLVYNLSKKQFLEELEFRKNILHNMYLNDTSYSNYLSYLEKISTSKVFLEEEKERLSKC